MKIFFIGVYDKKEKRNTLVGINAPTQIDALSVCFGNLVYALSTKQFLKQGEYLLFAREVSTRYVLSHLELLTRFESKSAMSKLSYYKNPSVIAVYDKVSNQNFIIEFDNTRYSEAISIFKEKLSCPATAGIFTETLNTYEEQYTNSQSLSTLFSHLKKRQYILSEVQRLKI